MDTYYTLATEDGLETRIFDFGFLQHRMREENKAGRTYTAARHTRSCACQPYEWFPLNGIYGHPFLGGKL